MPVAAVLGWPLTHTLSPALHAAAYRAAGLDDWRYEARPTAPGDLPAALGEVRTGALAGVNLTTPHKRAAGLDDWRYEARPTAPDDLPAALDEVRTGALAGVNLTTPHKRAAVPLLDRLADPAGELRAVNTVVPGTAGGELLGANTDMAGGLWALAGQLGLGGPAWDGEGAAVLLGTGGVALAMARAWRSLAERRALAGLASAPLTVAGRDLGRAALVAALAGPGATTLAFDRAADTVASASVVIQATTLTATGRPVPGQDRLRPGSFVLDCNYGSSAGGSSAGGPDASGLVAAARAAGAAGAVGGVGMLLAQAAEAVTLMTGVQPDRAAMAAAVGLPWPRPA